MNEIDKLQKFETELDEITYDSWTFICVSTASECHIDGLRDENSLVKTLICRILENE